MELSCRHCTHDDHNMAVTINGYVPISEDAHFSRDTYLRRWREKSEDFQLAVADYQEAVQLMSGGDGFVRSEVVLAHDAALQRMLRLRGELSDIVAEFIRYARGGDELD